MPAQQGTPRAWTKDKKQELVPAVPEILNEEDVNGVVAAQKKLNHFEPNEVTKKKTR